jgi:hypothetical protein
MSMIVQLMSEPVSAAANEAQDLRLAGDVGGYDEIVLLLQVYVASVPVTVTIQTGMQTDSEDGWVDLGTFASHSAGDTEKKTFTGALRYIRWETDAAATFLITGVARRT